MLRELPANANKEFYAMNRGYHPISGSGLRFDPFPFFCKSGYSRRKTQYIQQEVQ